MVELVGVIPKGEDRYLLILHINNRAADGMEVQKHMGAPQISGILFKLVKTTYLNLWLPP